MADIKLGLTDVAAIRRGTTAITKVMLGTGEVWPGITAPPSTPTNLQAVTAGSTSVTLTWDGMPMATSYIVEYRERKAKVPTFSDEFDYANGTSLASTAGWDADWGTLTVNSGAITAPGIQVDSLCMATTAAPVDGYVEMLFQGGGNNYTGVSMRHNGLVGSNPRTEIVGEINPAGYFEISEFIAEPEGSGTHDSLGTTAVIYPGAMPSPVELRLEVVGAVARLYLDDVLMITGNVIANMTGTKARCGGWRNTPFSIYRFEMGTFAVGAWLSHSTPLSPTATVTGLITGASYDFRVAATNFIGTSAFCTPDSYVAGLGVPTISAVNPPDATVEGGTIVAVTGTNYAPDATSVTFDGGAEIAAVVRSPTTLDFVSPVHAAGTAALRVRTLNGDSAPYTYTFTTPSGGAPDDIPGLIGFWRADVVGDFTFSSGVNVSEWRANLGTATPWVPRGTNIPVRDTTPAPEVVLGQGNKALQRAFGLSQPYTVVFVMRLDMGWGNAVMEGSADETNIYRHGGDGQLNAEVGSVFGMAMNSTGFHVVTIVFNGSSSVMRIDGTEVTGTLGTAGFGATAYLGSATGGVASGTQEHRGHALYNRALTLQQRIDLEAWLLTELAPSAPTAPTAPTLNTATPASATTVALAWSAPSSTGGSTITDYVIEKSADGSTGWTVVTESVSTTTNYTVTGLTTGVIQYFRVKAVNAIGTGAASNVLSATPVAVTAPGAPTLNTATPGNTTVALAWTAGTTGGSAITGYLVEKSPNGTSSWTSAGTPTASPYTVTGLTNGTIQHFRVSAVNAVGTGAASNVLSATPVAGTRTPVATDNFNRADVSPLDSPWTNRSSGLLAISSNRIIIPNTNSDSLFQHSTHTDLHGYVQADMRQDNGYMGLATAITTPFRRDISAVFYPDGTVHLEEQPGGANLVAAYSGYTAGTTVTVRLEWDIDPGVTATYRVYLDDVLRLTGTSTTTTPASYGVGLGGYRQGGLTTFDNFEMGTL